MLGVDVFFEEQNIHTKSSEGELMLTILASYAQEESLSASENQKWRIRAGFENVELLNWRFLFGYRISKDGIQQKFLIAYDRLMAKRETVIADCKLMRSALSDCSAIDAELEALNEEINVVAGLVKACVKENASTIQSQEEYTKKYNGLLARYEKATERMKGLAAEKERKKSRERDLRLFIESLKKQPLVLKAWDERLWVALIDRATVYSDERIVFRFKSGSEIEAEV